MQFRRDDSEVQSPHHLSLQRFHALAPPSLPRVPVGSVPRSHRYYGTLRLPTIHPGGLVDSPAGTVLALLVSLPPSASTTHDGPGFWSPGSPTGSSGRRQQDLPSSRQILSMHALLPSDPGGTGAPGHSALAMLPSASDTASAPTISEFRGSITRPASSLSTLRSGGYPNATQDSLPGGGQPYPGGTRPAGSVRKVSETTHLTSSLPPSPSFARRTPLFALFAREGLLNWEATNSNNAKGGTPLAAN